MLKKPEVEGNIVADYMIGNTHIMISDAYINHDPEFIARTLRNIEAIYLRSIQSQAAG